MVHTKPFLTPHLETAKDMATEREEDTQLLYHCANFEADRPHCRRDTAVYTGPTQKTVTADENNIPQNAYWRCVCRKITISISVVFIVLRSTFFHFSSCH